MQHPINDLIGRQFGRLRVLAKTEKRKQGRVLWRCRCVCKKQTQIDVTTSYLRNGKAISCGCLQIEHLIDRSKTHGATKHPLFRRWQNIKYRCSPKNKEKRKDYFDRNIRVWAGWIDDYPAFRDYMLALPDCPANIQTPGTRAPYTIDRIDNDGNYEPGNVRWVVARVQANNRRDNHKVTLRGQTLNFKEAVERYAIVSLNTIQFRIKNGWPIEKAFFTPYLRVHKK